MKYIFLHIPKNGGSTLRSIVENQYKKSEMFHIQNPSALYALEKFNKKNFFARRRVKVFKGTHFAYGCHKTLRNPSKSKYFAMLRDPLERAQSYYYYIKRMPKHHLHDKIELNNMSFEEFVFDDRVNDEIKNSQVKFIAGIGQVQHCSQEIFDRALKHIDETFFLVGIMEYFAETLFLLQQMLEWKKPIDYTIINANPKKNYDLDRHIEEKLISINTYDLKLYEMYRAKFENTLASYDPSQLESFLKSLNKE
jgi:hypothetical protein